MSKLTNEILLHVFNGLGITKSVDVSLISDSFLLPKQIKFKVLDEDLIVVKLWGAQITIDKSRLRLLCGDFSMDTKELALVIKLDNCPSYGCYLSFQDIKDSFIVFSLKDNEWLMANTYVQATFLAGMEQLRDIGTVWNTLSKYDDLVENIKSLVEYHDTISDVYEDEDDER